MQKPYVVVVDAYSAGNLLAPEFKSRGYECLHVQSTPKIWDILLPTYRPDDFKHHFAFDDNFEELVGQLCDFPIACFVPGTETGVELADRLSEALAVPTNGTEKSEARRDKYLMIETVRDHGLRAAEELLSDRAEEVVAWKARLELPKIVVKPVKSAGTDSVAICETDEEVRRAVNAIVGTINKLGLKNTNVLAQEFLVGTEYFLNTVSSEGKAHFTEIWRYRKRTINGHDCVYDCNELLPYEGEIQEQMRNYVLGVLEALEINEGPAHTEVIMTPTGPVLVETGARMDGLSVPSVNLAAVGYGPLDLTADAYVDKEAFAKKSAVPYPLLKHALTVYLTSYEEGVVGEIPGEEKLRALPSFFQMRLRVKPGSSVKKTIDYFTAPGFLTLVHEDKNVVMADYETIRSWESRGEIFTIA